MLWCGACLADESWCVTKLDGMAFKNILNYAVTLYRA